MAVYNNVSLIFPSHGLSGCSSCSTLEDQYPQEDFSIYVIKAQQTACTAIEHGYYLSQLRIIHIPEKNSMFMKFTGIFGCRPIFRRHDRGYIFMNLPTMMATKATQMKPTSHLW